MNATVDIPAPPARKPPGRVGPPLPGTSYHRLRKRVHLACFLIFVALPLTNLVRFDIPRQRFYFAGYELWISEFAIIFFSLMFLMFVVAGMAMIYGRLYCGYLCPQMIFSEAATSAEQFLTRWTNRRFARLAARHRAWLARALFSAALLAASVFLAFIFISYFVEPRDLLRRLLAFDIHTAGGIAGATTTLITLLDLAFVRQRFCATVCPYGYLQGILSDRNTLLVRYHDDAKVCIECLKCVRDCPMQIDIRRSAFQIECIHCGDCIDACSGVLGRLGRPTLIEYAWGEHGETLQAGQRWWRRLGLRDGKRFVVLLIVLFYVCGLYAALSMRQPVLVSIAPDRSVLYRAGSNGLIYNHFRLRIANRSSKPAEVSLELAGLPDARLVQLEVPLLVQPGETVQREFDIAAATTTAPQMVNHFRIVARVRPPEQGKEEFPLTFLAPGEKEPK